MRVIHAAALAAILAAPVAAFGEGQGEGLDLWPWERQTAPEPPPVKPYSLPTFEGHNDDHKAPIPILVKAPHIPAEAVFYRVLECYPAGSKWKLDIALEARARTADVGSFDTADGTALGSNYIGIVARMPLYSATELDRQREREHRRRQDTAKTVADFVQAVAARNHALRELGLYSSLEARARLRVLQGIAEASEQVGYLEKTARAQEALIKAETAILEHRLKLVAACEDRKADGLNHYLSGLAQVPDAPRETPEHAVPEITGGRP